MKNWMKNTKGENNYSFKWMDEDGKYVGFNDVWAPNMAEARKRAKKMESKSKWLIYDVIINGNVVKNGGKEWYKGMFINPKSFKRSTYESSARMDKIAHMITC